MPSPKTNRSSWPVRFWHRKVREPVMRELTHGTSLPKVTLACILGLVSASWPQIATNPLMALLLAWIFRCNKAITSGISIVFNLLQYILMIPFLRFGETLLGLPHFKTSVPEIITIVITDPIGSFAILGMPLLHAILGWIVAWLIVGPACYFLTKHILKRMMQKNASPKSTLRSTK
jgi:uncharacterized protein (DUF2062 family)